MSEEDPEWACTDIAGEEILRRAAAHGWTFNFENYRRTGYSRQDPDGKWRNLMISHDEGYLFVVLIDTTGRRQILTSEAEVSEALI